MDLIVSELDVAESSPIPSTRKRKQGRERTRASRACDRCKARKTRCSGKYPCTLCSRMRLECAYTASYRRGRPPSIELDTGHLQELLPTSQDTDEPLSALTRSPKSGSESHHDAIAPSHIPSPISMGNTRNLEAPGNRHGSSNNPSSRSSPEPLETDLQGHFVGPSSGASFLLRIQRKLQQQPSAYSIDSSIFTFGDLPLQEPATRFLILPPRTKAESMLCRYFEFGAATHRFLHRQTVQEWLAELYDTHGVMKDKATAASRTALLFMVFASAENYPENVEGRVDPAASTRFFFAAEEQLLAEKGAIRLESVQTRLMQCLFLLAHSRINHCWSLFGTTAHLMLALGIHRKPRRTTHSSTSFVELECKKRVFWCAFNLDTYLSAALGRPRTFREDDIDQELPLRVDDHQFSHSEMASLPSTNLPSLSIISGAVAHIKLSRIVANVLRDLYDIHPPSTEDQFALAAKYAKEIDSWRAEASYLVGNDAIDPTLLQPIFRRQRNVLSLACWHAQILVHRPFLLSNFASLANLGSKRRNKTKKDEDLTEWHVQSCLDAAMNIVKAINELSSSNQLYNTFWFSHYFAFCAVVSIYVYSIQQRHSSSERYVDAFIAATKCQTQITTIAIPGSLPHRYGVVLQELRSELLRLNTKLALVDSSIHEDDGRENTLFERGGPNMTTSGQDDGLMALGTETQHGEGNNTADGMPLEDDVLGFVDESPGSSVMQIAGWSQFDSLVTGGYGSSKSYLDDGDIGNWGMEMGGQFS